MQKHILHRIICLYNVYPAQVTYFYQNPYLKSSKYLFHFFPVTLQIYIVMVIAAPRHIHDILVDYVFFFRINIHMEY